MRKGGINSPRKDLWPEEARLSKGNQGLGLEWYEV